jgi:hypothetical protein
VWSEPMISSQLISTVQHENFSPEKYCRKEITKNYKKFIPEKSILAS